MGNLKTKEESEVKDVVTILQKLFIGYTPEQIEDMIFHVFEDANLQAGDLNEDEKVMRHDFHIASRKILRMLTRRPELLEKLQNQ